MKKIISLITVVALIITVCCSCAPQETENEKLLVASFYPIYILTLNLVDGIDTLRLECMAEQNVGCLHDYQLLSKDARLIADADAFIINGAGMEVFLEDVYKSVENLNVIDSSENIELLENCSDEHHHEGENSHHHHHSVNSHIWMSVKNAVLQSENIANGLLEIFPQYKEQISQNKSDFIKRLTLLDSELEKMAQQLKGANIITFHESYDYLARDYSFNIIEKVESHDGGEPSAKGIAELVEVIEKEKVSVLFTEPDYKGSVADILSRETGVKICTLNPVLKGEKICTAYETIMRENMNIILKAVS